jgi:uncharacterized protein YndB with AHSA1/START domain
MLAKAAGLVFVLALIFIGYVANRDGNFKCERSGEVHALPQEIFPYLSELKLSQAWSPYEKSVGVMTKKYTGTDGAVGSAMEFEGGWRIGSGRIEILRIVPNELVELKLTMGKPFFSEQFIQYNLTPTLDGAVVNLSILGRGGFIGKILSIFIDSEKLIGDQFSLGILNLKHVVESSKT